MTPKQIDALEKWLNACWPPTQDYPNQDGTYLIDRGRYVPIGDEVAHQLYWWCKQTRALIEEVRSLQGTQGGYSE